MARMRLFCLPPSGGAATLFRAWRELLPEDVDVWAVQLPGRESRVRERPLTEMRALVRAVTSAMRPHLELPFAIFGHSMGGLVGFEVARQLREAGARQPFHLFVSAARPPHVPDLDGHHLLTDAQLIAELRKMEGYAPEVLDCAELMEVLLPTIRADSTVTETYSHVPGAPLDCPVTAFAGTRDAKVPREEVESWRMYTHGHFRQVLCDGGHDFLTTASAVVVQNVSLALRADLSQGCEVPA